MARNPVKALRGSIVTPNATTRGRGQQCQSHCSYTKIDLDKSPPSPFVVPFVVWEAMTATPDFQAIFDQIPDGVLLVQGDESREAFRFLTANAALLNSLGVELEQLAGHTPQSLLPAEQATLLCDTYRICLQTQQLQHLQFPFDGSWGRQVWQLRMKPFRAPGFENCLLVLARDVTASTELSQHLDVVADYLPGFVYQMTFDQVSQCWRYLYVGRSIKAMFGLSAEAVLANPDSLLDRIHSDDREQVFGSSLRSVQSLTPWQSEFRILRPDGEPIWVSARDLPLRLQDGSVVVTGYAEDITERKDLEARLRSSELRFRSLIENANDIIATIESDGTLSYVSPNAESTLGYRMEEIIGTNMRDYLHPDDIRETDRLLEHVYTSGLPLTGIEYRVRHNDGHWVWHLTNAAPIPNRHDAVEAVMIIARDGTRIMALREELQTIAATDALTGLLNRVSLEAKLALMLHQAAETSSDLAVLFIDLDNFKPVNDHYGHAVGDRLLILVGERIRSELRADDVLARPGGDEFVVLLPMIESVDRVMAVAERIRARLAATFQFDGVVANISASIGVALYPNDGRTPSELMYSADHAMYKAKRNGRNQVSR